MNLENPGPKSKGMLLEVGRWWGRDAKKIKNPAQIDFNQPNQGQFDHQNIVSPVMDYSSLNNSGIHKSILLTNGTKREG